MNAIDLRGNRFTPINSGRGSRNDQTRAVSPREVLEIASKIKAQMKVSANISIGLRCARTSLMLMQPVRQQRNAKEH